MPNAITIPKKFTRGKELLVVPRKDWESLLRIARRRVSQLEVDDGLRKALEEVKKGKITGPFYNGKDLVNDLESKG